MSEWFFSTDTGLKYNNCKLALNIHSNEETKQNHRAGQEG